jgi:hypothetical protein
LYQSRSGSSSGIHSLIACHGGSIGSMVSMPKGGLGGGGMSMMPSHRPQRWRKNSIYSGRFKAPESFMGALQQGHWSGSAPQTLRMRSRQRGRMERALCFGGAGTRRMVNWTFKIGGRFRWADDAVGDEGSLAAGFVGVESVGLFRIGSAASPLAACQRWEKDGCQGSTDGLCLGWAFAFLWHALPAVARHL